MWGIDEKVGGKVWGFFLKWYKFLKGGKKWDKFWKRW